MTTTTISQNRRFHALGDGTGLGAGLGTTFESEARPSRRSSGVRLMMAGGAALMLASATLGLTAVSHAGGSHQSRAVAVAAQAGADPAASPAAAITARDVTVVSLTYEPGHSSGWHVHSGLHAVAVLSGSLTVYDEACQPHVFGPGDSYVGGQAAHVARNEADAPVEMIVTAIEMSGPAGPGSHLPAPAGCPVS